MRLIPFMFLFVVVLQAFTLAQTDTAISPLVGGYVIANSAELYYLATPSGGTSALPWILDYDSATPALNGNAVVDTLACGSVSAVTGDFNADGKEEVVMAWRGSGGQLCLGTRSASKNGTDTWSWNTTRTFVSTTDTVQTTVRLVRGHFDRDDAEEFLVAYWSASGTIRISIYDLDTGLMPVRKATVAGLPLAASLGAMAQFDVSVGDFDKDRFGEIVLAVTVQNSVAHEPVDLQLKLYNVDAYTGMITPGADTLLRLGTFGQSTDTWRNKFALSAGDYDNDGYDECVAVYHEGFWRRWLMETEVDIRVLPFAPDPTLSLFNVAFAARFASETWTSNQVSNVPPAGGGSVATADVDGDGYAELVVAGLDQVRLWKSIAWPAFALCSQTTFNTCSGGPAHGLIAVADVNGDTSQASWKSEVIVAEYNVSSWLSTIASNPQIRVLDLVINRATFPYAITGFTPAAQKAFEPSSGGSFFIAAGDFDGDAIAVRSPRLITAESYIQPLVILNVPPTHYDVLNGLAYDVCKSFPDNTTFKATYVKSSSSTSEFSTEQTKDWTLSANIGAKLGDLIGLNFSAKYGESFSKKTGSSTEISISDETHTSGDDYFFASVSKLHFWEYPLYIRGASAGNALVVIPGMPTLEWFPRKDPRVFRYDQSHEVGNILSYMRVPSLLGTYDIGSIVCNSFQGYTVSDKAGKVWEVALSASQDTNTQWSKSVDLELGGSLSKWGIDIGVSGSYASKTVQTHASKATRGVKITLDVGSPDVSLGEANYTITPLVYWSNTGALVVDYAIEPTVWSFPDTSLRTWWQRKYSQQSDPAFILPWRLDSQKSGDSTMTEPQKILTKSIRLSPATASAGDTVLISVRVHNFSLLETPSPVTVRLFVGDPDSGGTAIAGLGGITELTTGAPIAARDYYNFSMYWIVSGPGLSASTRIYGVIDPAGSLSEIHEDNNKGWTILTVPNVTGIDEQPNTQVSEGFMLHQNYPNPFNPKTVLRYALPGRTHVVLTVFDVLGRQVTLLADAVQEAGTHNVWFDGGAYASGVYFCRMQAGGFVQTRKLMLVK